MSDFDKEAEREKLRKKYEEDKQKREATEKMSELLLQGATMTNAHCSECGDPIFRYDGQEFCAACEKPVDRDSEESGDETDGASGGIEVTEPSDDARVAFGGESASETEGGRETESTADRPETTAAESAGGRREDGATQSGRNTRAGRPTEGSSQRQPPQGHETSRSGQSADGSRQPRSVDGDLADARASLVRTLTRFSQQADACEDPQRAQEYLAAAREAAATLDELRR